MLIGIVCFIAGVISTIAVDVLLNGKYKWRCLAVLGAIITPFIIVKTLIIKALPSSPSRNAYLKTRASIGRWFPRLWYQFINNHNWIGKV